MRRVCCCIPHCGINMPYTPEVNNKGRFDAGRAPGAFGVNNILLETFLAMADAVSRFCFHPQLSRTPTKKKKGND